jgi:cell division initiation protein
MREKESARYIQEADFSGSLRGYDREEVDAFLRSVAEEHQRLIDELSASRRKTDKPFQSLGTEVGELLQRAKDSADGLRGRAQEEAEQIRRQAVEAAAATQRRAEQEAKKVEEAADYEASTKIEEARRRARRLKEAEAEALARVRDVRTELSVLSRRLEDVEAALGGSGSEETPSEPRDAPVEGLQSGTAGPARKAAVRSQKSPAA